MSHFAEIDENNIVTRVLVGDNNDPIGDEGYQWLLDHLGREKTHFSATLQVFTLTREEPTMAKQVIKTDEKDSTKCYTYALTMIVQVIAENEQSAKEKLDKEGGYVTSRTTNLVDAISLYNGDSKEQQVLRTTNFLHQPYNE